MPESALIRLKGLRQAMCLECGAVRSAQAQGLGRSLFMLPCGVCERDTTHAAINWDGPDAKEAANHLRSEVSADVSREHAALLALFRSCQIELLEGEPLGGLVDAVRWLEPEGYQVRMRRDLALVDRVYCLDWAWKSIRPAIAEWHRCLVEVDLDGQPFQRIYNNELERGVYEVS